MDADIQIARRSEITEADLECMHRLRARVFQHRMGWDVTVLSGMEIDAYDALNPYYMIIRTNTNAICGCWRMLPTTGPHMLKDTFPELLYGVPAPASEDTWELSRFAIESEHARVFGFTKLALNAMTRAVMFGDQNGVRRYVTVTTPSIERLLLKTGVSLRRFGPPMQIGIERALALDIDIGKQTQRALLHNVDDVA